MVLHYYGTAMLTVEYDNTKLLIDPFFNRNPELYRAKAEDFDDVNAVLITHGHFDHIQDLPEILKRRPNLDVYCTQQVKKNLDALGSEGGIFHIISLEDKFEIGPFKVHSIETTHITYDFAYILKRAIDIKFYLGLLEVLKILQVFSKTKLGDENLEFLIEAGGKNLLIAGSLGDYEPIKHPQGVDIFAMPYNGRWFLNEHMYNHVRKVLPKTIFMTHYDASFPPLCMDTKPYRFKEFLKDKMPEIDVIIPEYNKPYDFYEYHESKIAN